jgi:hypothetical protein
MTFYISLELFLSFVMSTNRTRQANLIFINPLNAELNPICHLLALLGDATIVVVSRLRVKGSYCVDKVVSVLNKPHHGRIWEKWMYSSTHY